MQLHFSSFQLSRKNRDNLVLKYSVPPHWELIVAWISMPRFIWLSRQGNENSTYPRLGIESTTVAFTATFYPTVPRQPIFSYTFFLSLYLQLLAYGLVVGVVVLPLVTVEAESAPKMDQETQVEAFVFKANELYAKRFSGIVNDCFAWGVV